MELPERCRTRVSFFVSPPGSPEVDISHRFRAGGSSSFRNRWEISTSQRRCLNGSRPGGKSLWSFRLFDTVGLFGKCVRASNTSDGNMAAAQQRFSSSVEGLLSSKLGLLSIYDFTRFYICLFEFQGRCRCHTSFLFWSLLLYTYTNYFRIAPSYCNNINEINESI